MDVDCDGIDYKCDVGSPKASVVTRLFILTYAGQQGWPGTDRLRCTVCLCGAASSCLLPLKAAHHSRSRSSSSPRNMCPLETKTPFLETTSPPLSGMYLTHYTMILALTSDSNGKMFYGILGDTNGNDPQVTGEASWLMARTCFPDDDLRGNSGHAEGDVTCKHPVTTNLAAGPLTRTDILFTGPNAALPPSAVNEHYITTLARSSSWAIDWSTPCSSTSGSPVRPRQRTVELPSHSLHPRPRHSRTRRHSLRLLLPLHPSQDKLSSHTRSHPRLRPRRPNQGQRPSLPPRHRHQRTITTITMAMRTTAIGPATAKVVPTPPPPLPPTWTQAPTSPFSCSGSCSF
jgi:hypothetical protein